MTDYGEKRSTTLVPDGCDGSSLDFSKATKQQNIIANYLRRLQETEDLSWALLDAIAIDSPFDFVADLFGKIVGRGRNGLSTEDYWIAIRAQQAINRSHGTSPDLFEVFGLSAPTKSLRVHVFSPSTTLAWMVENASDINVSVVAANLLQVSSLGRRLIFAYSLSDPGNQLRYGWSGDLTLNTGNNGLGWSGDTTIGGRIWANYHD